MLEKIKALIDTYKDEDAFFKRLRLHFPRGSAEYRMISQAYSETLRDFHDMRRDGGSPYFGHPEAVAVITLEYLRCYDPIQVTAALLHDNIEDLAIRGWTFERVQNSYGQAVAELVWWVSKPDVSEYGGCKEERDLVYHTRLRNAPREAVKLKLSDRLHNLITLDQLDIERQRRKIRETRIFYLPLAEVHTILIHEIEAAIQNVESSLNSSTHQIVL